MVQKHVIVSMIAPVAIGGILIMAMAAISSINQAFAVGEESNNTGKEATSHESNNNGNEATSHESNNTGTSLSAQGAEQQSNNTGKRTELTLSASRNAPDKKVLSGGGYITWVPVMLSGRLTSGGSGVAGAFIIFSCDGETCEFQNSSSNGAYTDSGGHYSVGVLVGHKWKIDADFNPENQNSTIYNHLQSSGTSTTIQVNGATSQKSSNTGGAPQESNNNGNEATSHKSKNTGTALSAQGAEQQSKTFTANLNGSNAIPPVNTTATGTAYFELSSNGKVLNYNLSTTNLKGFKEANICQGEQNINYTTNKTYFSCGSVAGPLSMGKGKITSDDLYGRYEDAPLSDLIKGMRSGELYVGVDTQQHHWHPPGTGEIFGQIRSGR